MQRLGRDRGVGTQSFAIPPVGESIVNTLIHTGEEMNIKMVPIDLLEAAPSEWNFYKPLGERKMQELIDSIYANGMLHPVVVWAKENGKYMILSGHNRIQAVKIIGELLENEAEKKKYAKIPALVKQKGEIDENTAQQIIIDTNWVQRDLSPVEKARSISKKYVLLKSTSFTGKRRDVLAKEYNITGRQIDVYRNLLKLIPPFQQMVEQNQLSLEATKKLTSFPKEMQQWIYDEFGDQLDNKKIKKLRSDLSKEEIASILENKQQEFVEIRTMVPEHLKEEFKKMINTWIKENE